MFMNSIDWPNLLSSTGEVDYIWNNFMHISIGRDKFIHICVKTCHPYYNDYPPCMKCIYIEQRRLKINRKDPGVLAKYYQVCIIYKSAIDKIYVHQETELLKYIPTNL